MNNGLKSNKRLILMISILIIVLILIAITSVFILKKQCSATSETIADKEYTAIGNKVQIPEEWNSLSTEYAVNEDGTTIKSTVITSNVYAVSTGNGEVVPVPNGFYYVGGNLDTGVIISDNSVDEYDAITDKTTYEYTKELQGNQFVWIPCTEEEYVKTDWGASYQNSNWETTGNASETAQIKKYGGFYVGRYEAGLAKTITEYTSTQLHSTANQVYNLTGIPQSKANLIPWTFIDWNKAQENSKLLYDTDSVRSGLITGTQWDVMLNKLIEKTELELSDINNSAKWGNYMNNTVTYNGRLARAYLLANKTELAMFGGNETGSTKAYSSGNGDLISTGASSITEKYHIFDVAGNVWEWTEENSFAGGTNGVGFRELRGGSFAQYSSNYPASYRLGNGNYNHIGMDVGFRMVLYIQ